MKEEIIEYLYRNNIVSDICKNVTRSNSYYVEDLIQEIFIILLEYNEDKLKFAYENNQLKFLISRLVTNQYNSSTSGFYKKFKKDRHNSTDITYDIENKLYEE